MAPASLSVSRGTIATIRVFVTNTGIMRIQDMFKRNPSTIKANILDPMGGVSFDQFDDPCEFMDAMMGPVKDYRVEEWTIGDQISLDDYKEYRDPKTNELYVVIVYKEGNPNTYLVKSKQTWLEVREKMSNPEGLI